MKTYRVIIWGLGKVYGQYLSLIQSNINNRSIEVVGVTSNEKEILEIDGFKFITKTELNGFLFDYCIIAVENVKLVINEAVELGINKNKLIPIFVFSIPYFDFRKYIAIKERNISIISQMCFGGMCYHRLGWQFSSPTINMAFKDDDFYRFISNLKFYIEQPVEFVEWGYEENLKREYPICRIKDVRLLFNHYTSYEEAVSYWEKRKKRINWNDLLYIAYTENQENEKRFNELDLKRKIIFVPYPTDYPSSVYIRCGSEKYNGNFGMVANDVASGVNNEIDLLSLLSGERNFRRIK